MSADMEAKVGQRPQYVHKRQVSGSNETTTVVSVARLPAAEQETATISSEPSSIVTTSTTLSTESSQASVVNAAKKPASSQDSSGSPLVVTTAAATTTTSISSVVAPTTISTLHDSDVDSKTAPAAVPIPVSSPSTGRQLIAAPSVAVAPSASSSPSTTLPQTSVAPASTPSITPSSAPEVLPSSIIVDTTMRTAGFTSIPKPSFLPITSEGSSVSSSLGSKSDSATSTSSDSSMRTVDSLSGGTAVSSSNSGLASAQQTGVLADGVAAQVRQPTPIAAIAGGVIGGIAAFILLALIGLCCIKRRYKNRPASMAPFSRRPSSTQSISTPPDMEKTFRPNPALLFHKISRSTLSTIHEQDTRSSSPLPPPYQRSRSNTTPTLPPAIPARSAARPPPETATAMDVAFMGTFSAYVPSSSSSSAEQNPFSNNTALLPGPVAYASNHENRRSVQSLTASEYSSVSQNSYLNIPSAPASTLPPANNPFLVPSRAAPPVPIPVLGSNFKPSMESPHSSISASIPIPQPLSIPAFNPLNQGATARTTDSTNSPTQQQQRPHTRSSVGLSLTHGPTQWRDSIWSTSATPIASGISPDGHSGPTSGYFSRVPSHRVSRSVNDVLPWSEQRSGLATLPPLHIMRPRNQDGDAEDRDGYESEDVPRRIPLRGWPLGN